LGSFFNFKQGKLRRKKKLNYIVEAIFNRTLNGAVTFRGEVEYTPPLGRYTKRA